MLPSRTLAMALVASFMSGGCGSFDEAKSNDGASGSSGASSSGASSSGSSGSSGTPADGAETIVSGLTGPRALHATAGGVYWLSIVTSTSGTQERIHRCPLDGCKGASALLLDEQVDDLTAEGADIFWAANGTIHSCAVGDTCARKVVHTAASRGVLVATSSRLYFTGSSSGSFTLQVCERASCGGTVRTAWQGDGIGPVHANEADVWYTSGQPSTLLQRLAHDQAAVPSGTLPGLPTSIAASATNVFFVSRNALYYCDVAPTCTPVVVDSADTGIFNVRRFGAEIFYPIIAAGGSPGRIKRCTTATCSSSQVVVEGGNPRDVAVHDGWLYWAEAGNERTGGASIKRVRL